MRARMIVTFGLALMLLWYGVSSIADAQTSSQRVVIAGKVLTVEGAQPLAGAIVTIRSGRRVISVTSAKTDVSGAFQMEVQSGSGALSVIAPEHETLSSPLMVTASDDLEFRLRRATPVRGIVLDVGGKAVPRVRVRLLPLEAGGLTPILQTNSKRDGQYVLRGASQSAAYALEASHEGCPWKRLRVGSGNSLAQLALQSDIVVNCR